MKDNYKISGIMTFPKINTDTLLLFIHGFIGHGNHHLFTNGARFFARKGMASYRFSFYTEIAPIRSKSIFPEIQATYLNNIIRHFGQAFKFIYLISHSMGAISALMAREAVVSGLIMWDPSRHPKDIFSSITSHEYDVVLDSKLIHNTFKIPNLSILARSVSWPTATIAADLPHAKFVKSTYFKNLKKPISFSKIKGSNHNFDNPCSEAALFQITLDAINRMAIEKRHHENIALT